MFATVSESVVEKNLPPSDLQEAESGSLGKTKVITWKFQTDGYPNVV
jgi:hypothetical protein